MSTLVVDKRSHPLVRKIKEVRDGKDRSLIFCEGLKLVNELCASKLTVTDIFCSKEQRAKISRAKPEAVLLTDDVMRFVSDVDSPPGVIALAKRPSYQPTKAANPLFLVIDRLQLPQNVGALMRTAEAAGVTEVWVSTQSADPFSAKAIRGSSASVFRMPVRQGLDMAQAVAELKSRGVVVMAATQNGDQNYDAAPWEKPSALVVGAEGGGFTKAELELFDRKITIPMAGEVESLNVAVAAAVCLFEAAKKRRKI